MGVFLTRTFQKRFEGLPSDMRDRIREAILKIPANPQAGKRLLGDLEGEFSCRVGAYRIVYFIDPKGDIWLETVRHRKDVYRKK
jgi:mRNA-degrading endonuclease RelE of RelBE toxin-antitoxin system